MSLAFLLLEGFPAVRLVLFHAPLFDPPPVPRLVADPDPLTRLGDREPLPLWFSCSGSFATICSAVYHLALAIRPALLHSDSHDNAH